MDDILAMNGSVALQEGMTIPGCGLTIDEILAFTLLPDGRWFARGDDPAEDGWVTENGSCRAVAGDDIYPGSPDHWYRFTHALGNLNGDTVLGGDIDDPTFSIGVLVLNDTEEIAREGDPIDLDGNGAFDDDVFLNGFKADQAFLTENGGFYFLATLRSGVGDDLGDAFLLATFVIVEPGHIRGDCNVDLAFNIADAIASLGFLFSKVAPFIPCDDACDSNDDGMHNVADPIYTLGTLFSNGPSPPEPHPRCGLDPTFDNLGCDFPPCP